MTTEIALLSRFRSSPGASILPGFESFALRLRRFEGDPVTVTVVLPPASTSVIVDSICGHASEKGDRSGGVISR